MYEDLTVPYQAPKDIASLQLGGILAEDKVLENAPVNLVLKSFNRHGLIAGATGSGKTKTIQVLSEQLSLAGVPCLVMDIKGDVSGLAMPGEANPGIEKRCKSLQLPFTPRSFPVELYTLSSVPGVPLRATISDFGALLFSRMLEINETQAGVVTILFEYAKDNAMPLIDLHDFKALLQYVQSKEGNAEIESQYGSVAATSIGSIMRKIVELESQGGKDFFGEPAFKIEDLLQYNENNQGIISIIRLMDMQDRPQLFSTFMLKLLTDIYRQLPELGDPDKPKLVLFIDEAHLIFKNANKALLSTLDTIVKLIRSKGVGLIFCTQTPNDIPEAVLGQLGLKVQHALRAFTAKDRQAMKLVAQNFPPSTHYDTEKMLTSLGIGEALLSALDAEGEPTPLVHCLMRPPESRMGVLTESEVQQILNKSHLYQRYSRRENPPSAAEMLAAKKQSTTMEAPTPSQEKTTPSEPSIFVTMSKNTLVRQVVRDFFRWLLKSLTSRKR
ncbi:helicase HerA-like domain-containing protein [Legionella bozemanae]|uniref:ATPase n=1 Tax=Legionella bozemanae TaxID=447 RepID=A0A0W0RZI4_LEGBO|nr:helicase HerA-like domain-containing protein [Legionella bozemanae]KTC76510.1 ATPase [Legionella bozemanae]STO35377.1 Ornithine/acetylornithine aminotransferase [Legionella bozemanae]